MSVAALAVTENMLNALMITHNAAIIESVFFIVVLLLLISVVFCFSFDFGFVVCFDYLFLGFVLSCFVFVVCLIVVFVFRKLTNALYTMHKIKSIVLYKKTTLLGIFIKNQSYYCGFMTEFCIDPPAQKTGFVILNKMSNLFILFMCKRVKYFTKQQL